METADWARAEAILVAARDALEDAGAAGSHSHLALLRHLADLRKRQGRFQEAAEIMQQVTAALEVEHDEGEGKTRLLQAIWRRRMEYAEALRSAAETQNFLGQLVPAVNLFEQAQNAYQTAGDSSSPAYVALLTQLGGCLCRQGRHAEAEDLLASATAVLEAGGLVTPADGE